MEHHEEIGNSTDAVLEINKKKKDFKIELVLFFILGFLLGVTFKTEAVKRITIGFEDYKIVSGKDSYDVTAIKNKLIRDAEQSQQNQEENMEGEVQLENVEEGQ